MKILVIGDQHFRFELPYSHAIKDGRRKEWQEIKDTIHNMAKVCDAVVLLGDNFNSRHNHSSVIKEFVDFLNGFGDKEVHILVGNHERYGSSTALDFLKEVKNKNWHVYTEPVLTDVAGQPSLMVPFMTPALLGVGTREEGVKKIVNFFPKTAWPLAFIHHAIAGSKYIGRPVDDWEEIILPQKDLEQHFAHVFAGHVHSKQNLFPSIYVTGSILTHEVGEFQKSIWVYESDGTIDVSVQEIPLPVRGIRKLEWVDDAEAKFAGIPDESIVKCYVTKHGTDIELVKKTLERFDASIVIEQYPSDRQKVHFEDGVLDLSVETMLKHYAEAKQLPYADLNEGFELIKK